MTTPQPDVTTDVKARQLIDRLLSAERCSDYARVELYAGRILAALRQRDAALAESRQGMGKVREALRWTKWLLEQHELKPIMEGKWGDPEVVKEMVVSALSALDQTAGEQPQYCSDGWHGSSTKSHASKCPTCGKSAPAAEPQSVAAPSNWCSVTYRHQPHDGCDGKPNAPTIGEALRKIPDAMSVAGVDVWEVQWALRNLIRDATPFASDSETLRMSLNDAEASLEAAATLTATADSVTVDRKKLELESFEILNAISVLGAGLFARMEDAGLKEQAVKIAGLRDRAASLLSEIRQSRGEGQGEVGK